MTTMAPLGGTPWGQTSTTKDRRGCAAAKRGLSKCLPTDAFQVAAETRAYLAEHGIDLGGEQQTKTRTALEFFAGELAAH